VADGNVSWREFYGHYARMSGRTLRSCPAPALWLLALGAEIFGALGGGPPILERAAVRYMTRRSHFSTEKARTMLGWSPAMSMGETMEETERWLRDAGILMR
jgi:nucleoside-diphosphate-sugar epimerase